MARDKATKFTVRIENITQADAFTASNGTKWSLGFSPGIAVVHTGTSPMGQSNDWFYTPAEAGIALFKNGKPVSGDITAELILWDAGTEVNQEPGIGSDQGRARRHPTPAKRRTVSCATSRTSATARPLPRWAT